jgi:hypothetical protein
MRSLFRLDRSERPRALSIRVPHRLTIRGAVAISAVVALVAALSSVCTIGLLPPKLEQRHLQIGGAATHVLVDSPRSRILDENSSSNDFAGLTTRGELLANLIASPPVLARIGRRIDVPLSEIAATVRLTAEAPPIMRDPDSEQRAYSIVQSDDEYRIELQTDPYRPILHIYTQAPTPTAAILLANTTVKEIRGYVRDVGIRDGAPASSRVALTQLGPARGGVINAGTPVQMAALTALVTFCICCWMLLLGQRIIQGWRAPKMHREAVAPVDEQPPARSVGGDWPRTTRVLPWMIAAFIAMLWLIPFNTIELSASLPFDLKLDRLLLPLVVATWVLALAAGGAAAPRPRATWIHFGIGAFVGIACLSVVLNMQDLNRTLEFPLSVKKLILITSYLTLFAVIASSVRRSEVSAFLKYTLLLGVTCALGMIWEYRFHYNIFYSLSDQILPGFFQVNGASGGGFDATDGRALTRGPAEHPLEAVAILTMALPIALVGLINAKRRWKTVLYCIAACIIVAASVSTYRKSALLAPLSVGLTIAYFRRRELLRLAPLGAVAVFVISFLSPGALGSLAEQFSPQQLGVGTVSDRASDYDAVRPDVWAHLILGRGFGSYDHVSYRLLDSEILGRTVDIGVLGLGFVFLMIVIIVGVARPLIRSQHSMWSPPALAIAAAAISYLVVEFLFDTSSFPHTPYVLMTLAGLLAVIVSRSDEAPARSLPRYTAAEDTPGSPRAASQHDRTPAVL